LVAIQVAPYAKKTVDGSIEDLEASLWRIAGKVDYSVCNKAIIIKGCSKNQYEGLCYSSTSSTSLCQKHNVWWSLLCSSLVQSEKKIPKRSKHEKILLFIFFWL
jgi:hypothetical protein